MEKVTRGDLLILLVCAVNRTIPREEAARAAMVVMVDAGGLRGLRGGQAVARADHRHGGPGLAGRRGDVAVIQDACDLAG